MSHRLRRPLPALAIVAVALALPPTTTSTSAAVVSIKPSGFVDPRAPSGIPRKPSLGERAATIALEAVGVPYRWGGMSPSGFDCSGLVRWAYLHVGIDLPHSSYALYGVGREVSRSRIEAGDVLFFSGLGHVGLYLGGGRMVHAPYSGKNVEVVPLGDSQYGRRLVGARRVS